MRENELRGKIIVFLEHIYPENVEEMSIIGVLYEYHEPEDIRRALEYLTDRGYVARREIPHPYKERTFVRLYKITPSGIDLKAGLSKDAGVTVVEW